MVSLQGQGREKTEIAFLVSASEKLVSDYLAVYEQAQKKPHQLAKLVEEMERVKGLNGDPKKGGQQT